MEQRYRRAPQGACELKFDRKTGIVTACKRQVFSSKFGN